MTRHFLIRKLPNFKLNQSTRVVKVDVYYTVRPFKNILVQKLTERGARAPRRNASEGGQRRCLARCRTGSLLTTYWSESTLRRDD